MRQHSDEPHIHAEPGKVVFVKTLYGRETGEMSPAVARAFASSIVGMARCAERLQGAPEIEEVKDAAALVEEMRDYLTTWCGRNLTAWEESWLRHARALEGRG